MVWNDIHASDNCNLCPLEWVALRVVTPWLGWMVALRGLGVRVLCSLPLKREL